MTEVLLEKDLPKEEALNKLLHTISLSREPRENKRGTIVDNSNRGTLTESSKPSANTSGESSTTTSTSPKTTPKVTPRIEDQEDANRLKPEMENSKDVKKTPPPSPPLQGSLRRTHKRTFSSDETAQIMQMGANKDILDENTEKSKQSKTERTKVKNNGRESGKEKTTKGTEDKEKKLDLKLKEKTEPEATAAERPKSARDGLRKRDKASTTSAGKDHGKDLI